MLLYGCVYVFVWIYLLCLVFGGIYRFFVQPGTTYFYYHIIHCTCTSCFRIHDDDDVSLFVSSVCVCIFVVCVHVFVVVVCGWILYSECGVNVWIDTVVCLHI